MNEALKDWPDSTRVWIYLSDRPVPADSQDLLREQLANFAHNWVSHNRQLRAYADLLHERFVVLMVDESQAGASGCSIDKSVAFLKYLEETYRLRLFDRMLFAYRQGDEIRVASRDEFARLYADGQIDDNTLVFDNLVHNKADFDRAWLKPLKDSWHARMV